MHLTENEIEQRMPVWIALSSLWLDTELEDVDYQHIANVLHEKNVLIQDAQHIHTYEVAPVVRVNAMSVAGVWSGFDELWLKEQCSKYAAKRHTRWHRISCRLWGPYNRYHTKACWLEIEKHYGKGQPEQTSHLNKNS